MALFNQGCQGSRERLLINGLARALQKPGFDDDGKFEIMNNSLSRVSTDQKLIEMWLHGRPNLTQQEYMRDIKRFTSFVNKSLNSIVLENLQEYALHLQDAGLKPATLKRKLNAVKSLFTFAAKLNYIRFNVAAALRIPKAEYSVAGKSIRQIDVVKIINKGADNPRDKALITLLYATGMRVSELCHLAWSDFNEREDGEVQVNILGKGNKHRTVLVPLSTWVEVDNLRGESGADEPVFKSKNGRALDRTMVHLIIKKASAKVGASDKISAHSFRHSHASHSLLKGAPISLVRDTLGHSNISISNAYLASNPNDSSSKYLGI
ncbi:MAG: tyrosine-type recombinase/integrase [Calothrix sp. FI2-JRJ7]|jgi:integrase/recombinase XerD|nr:tyrosine-type recombinase/integrase [Calothrix sp. FI2-JRJ7]